jgi:hypothetical protein
MGEGSGLFVIREFVESGLSELPDNESQIPEVFLLILSKGVK